MRAAIRPRRQGANCVGGPARAGPALSASASGAAHHGTISSRSSQVMACASDRRSITLRQNES